MLSTTIRAPHGPDAMPRGTLSAPPTHLPALGIEAEWKAQRRLWGHSLHPMCSYLASFPAPLAHAFVARYSRPGDVVLDPFSGRGTTPLEATSSGRIGVGNDLNPLAHLLTAAKLEPATAAESRTRAATLRLLWNASSAAWLERAAAARGKAEDTLPGAPPRGEELPQEEVLPREVAVAFHPRTLAQVLFVRSALDLDDRVDRFLAAALSGTLHGKSASYLSTLMPNTFSMAPRYVRSYASRTAFQSPERDLFACLDAKLARLYRDALPTSPGIALLGDARDAGTRARAALQARGLPDRARLALTSPPYLRVIKYGYYNWLRAWFLGLDVRAIDRSLDDAHRREPYLAFLGEVLRDLRPALTDDGIAVLVVGDVVSDRGRPQPDGIGLAEQVWESAAAPAGYRLAGIALDDVHAHRKVTQLWGEEAGRATQTDRILVVAASEAGRRRALAGVGLPVDWTWPPRLRAL
ncbi:MAG TPA: DNA methyltransferase [Candidatus Limnocylindrales bacterium]|nr:DNA methyltransferase [Candidatus Limnocylindrales bacterium]